MAKTMRPLVTTCAVVRKPDRARGIASRLIHRSAWKGYSANFAQTAFSEVGLSHALRNCGCQAHRIALVGEDDQNPIPTYSHSRLRLVGLFARVPAHKPPEA